MYIFNVYIYIYIYTYIYIYIYVCVYRIRHELRGIELVKTIISELVSAVAFFKGFFDENFMTLNIFRFTMC